MLKAFILFTLTAAAEIYGCYAVLCRVWRGVCGGFARLVVGCRRRQARPLGYYRVAALPGRDCGHPLCPVRIVTVLQFEYRGYCVNLLDRPGHKDFSEDTYHVFTAVDAAVMVIDAQAV